MDMRIFFFELRDREFARERPYGGCNRFAVRKLPSATKVTCNRLE